MKKILVGTVLVIMLIGMATVVAQDIVSGPGEMPNECCIIRHNIRAISPDTETVTAGSIIGSADGPCVIEGVPQTPEIMSNWAAYCTIDTIYTVTDWIFWIVMILALLMFVIGGGIFVTSAGDPERAARGKKIVVYGIIGLAIALLAKLIPAVAKFLIGM